MHWSTMVLVFAVSTYTLVAAISDVRTRRLPNWLTVPTFAGGLAFHLIGGGLHGLLSALGGFAVGFGILLVLWLIGGGGGGDVKFMGALGAWLGTELILYVFIVSTIVVVIGSVVFLVYQTAVRGISHVRRKYIQRAALNHHVHRRRHEHGSDQERRAKRRILPYALPVAVGTWLVLAWKVVWVST